jgi:hypothetical protein
MGVKYTDETRRAISREAEGKVVNSLEWDKIGEYWTMTFADESEISFRFMAELV